MNARRCGYRGESAARLLLEKRGWTDIQRRAAGEKGDDLKATDPHGQRWSVEVKATVAYQPRYWEQAVKNCHGLPPMLMWTPKDRTGDWLVKRNRDGKTGWEVWRA